MPDSKKQPIGYLIGSIHGCKDRSKAFDASEKAVVEAGHTALNPVKEEPTKTGMSCDDTEAKLSILWSKGEFDEYRKLMEAIWEKDLDNVRRADYLVLHFEVEDTSVGAPVEMAMASLPYLLKLAKRGCEDRQKGSLDIATYALEKVGYFHKPIYWVCQGPISEVNSTLKWLILTGSDVRVFKTYQSLTDHLKETYK